MAMPDNAAQRRSQSYKLPVEDLDFLLRDEVRADMVYVPWPNGGAVFSVGSITWTGSLSHNGYDNNVSTVTENVLRRFLARHGGGE